MDWSTVNVTNRRRRGEAFATITNNRISLNIEACSLMDIKKYKYVEVLRNKNSESLKFIGLKFTKQSYGTTFSFIIRKAKDGIISGMDINSRPLIEKLFGEKEIDKTSKYSVSLDEDNENIIVIDLNKEL